MNVIRLMGGIGNQFFQYAFGRVFQERGKEIAYDLSWFAIKQTYPRHYILDKFQIPELKFSHFIPKNPTQVISGERYDHGLFLLDNYNFEGYWQYLSYYTDIQHILKNELILKPKVYTKEYLQLVDKINSSESVAVHVRRGDYLKVWPVMMSINYYSNAISQIEGDLFIFSDDIGWCRNAFREDILKRKITFVDLEDYLSFELMRLCKHKILGNSTFSWWAAFLENRGKVICPKDWLGFRNSEYENERYPKEWIKLENE